jgi:beta-lactam-binding protein with PASTA domain
MLRYFISKEFFLTLLSMVVLGVLIYLAIFFWVLPAYTRHGKSIVVPEVFELSYEEGVKKLEEEGLRAVLSDSSYNAELPPGSILAQYPKEHSFVKPNRTVSLTINQKNPPQVTIPNIIDKSLYQAKAQLESWKLGVGNVTRRKDIATNTILEIKYLGKAIKPGKQVPQGAKIDLVVSDGQGSAKVSVPDLTGYAYEDALNTIRDLGLSLGALYYNANGPANLEGTVYNQNPKPTLRDSLRTGLPIDLYIYGSEPVENEGILTEDIN